MPTFEVTQRLLSVATRYDVRKEGAEDVVMTIKGALTSATPDFVLVEGAEGKPLGTLKGNFAKTKFHVYDAEQKERAYVEFPAIAFKKTMTLKVGDATYTVDGGVFKNVFQCNGPNGLLLEVTKKEGLMQVRDLFVVKVGDDFPVEVGLLIATALHSRFFEMI